MVNIMKFFPENESHQSLNSAAGLPWESPSGENTEASQILMERILELPLSDLNFTLEPDTKLINLAKFDFNTSIQLAMLLLSIDKNLARVVSDSKLTLHGIALTKLVRSMLEYLHG
jgi:hypothetical protein